MGEAPRGVIIKLFGVVLMFLGTLDSMLSWRGGFVLDPAYVLLIAVGIALYVAGAVRRAGGPRFGPNEGAGPRP